MTLVTVDAVEEPLWERLIDKRSTSVFQSRHWLRVLAQTYGFPLRARVQLDEMGEPSAGIVYTELQDFLDPRVVSLPFSDFCDPVATDDGEWRAVVDGLLARGWPVNLRCLHNDVPLRDPRFVAVGRARWHAIDLKREEEEIWDGLHGSARRAIRKSRSEGVTVKFGQGEADLRAFYDLHMQVRKYKYGLLAQPFEFFTSIWEHFLGPDRGALMLAMLAGRPVAGCLFLEWQGTLYYKLNASDPQYLAARPNDQVLWTGICHARDRGLDHLDFGLTDWDQEGLIQYKRKYATEEKTITLLRHAPAGFPTPRDQGAREVLRGLTRLLVDESVPDVVSEEGGRLLYRYFT